MNCDSLNVEEGSASPQMLDRLRSTIGTMAAYEVSEVMGHCRRTANYAELMARQWDMSEAELKDLVAAALLHEVVNVETPAGESASTADSCDTIKTSYLQRLEMISTVPDLAGPAVIVRHQHENYDGTGFFDGLSGEQIPLASRILAIANAYDEILAGLRPDTGTTTSEAAAWFHSHAGTRFDPTVIEAFFGNSSPGAGGGKFLRNTELPVLSSV
jgi:response regulator RpfG family c-di-GMP phosphodiesterase